MTKEIIGYLLMTMAVVLIAVRNRDLISIRIICVCLLAGTIIFGPDRKPSQNARNDAEGSVVVTNQLPSARDDAGLLRMHSTDWWRVFPVLGLSVLALIPFKKVQKKS
jgi:hypothetical protein